MTDPTHSPSCDNCPNLVRGTDATPFSPFDYCSARNGMIVSRTNLTAEEQALMRIKIADSCSDYGLMTGLPVKLPTTPIVAGADPAALKVSAISADKPIACSGCKHFAPSGLVNRELGFPAPMCTAKGFLIPFAKDLPTVAQNCGLGVRGDARTNIDSVKLTDDYDLALFNLNDKPVTALESDPRHRVDPREYETDKEVTAVDQANHIRAWRRVDDPENLRPVRWMPIFHGQALCGYDPRKTYGNHRPDLYIDHAGLLYDLCCELLVLDETPLLIGGAGTGKTEAGCWMAWLMDLPFTRISVSKKTEMWQLWGQHVIETVTTNSVMRHPDGTETTETKEEPVSTFVPGRFVKAYQLPGIIMVDEPNLRPDFYEAARPAFDNARQLMVDENGGEEVQRGLHTFIMLSQNPPEPIYVGTEQMNAADTSRVSPVRLDIPDEPIERAIIIEHCKAESYDLPVQLLDKIMQISVDIRQAILDGSLQIAWGIRDQVKVAKKTQVYGLEKAYRRAICDGLPADESTQILGFVATYS